MEAEEARSESPNALVRINKQHHSGKPLLILMATEALTVAYLQRFQFGSNSLVFCSQFFFFFFFLSTNPLKLTLGIDFLGVRICYVGCCIFFFLSHLIWFVFPKVYVFELDDYTLHHHISQGSTKIGILFLLHLNQK